MNVLVLLKLGSAQAVSYLTPLARLSCVEHLHVVRHSRVPIPAANVVWHEYGPAGPLASLAAMYRVGSDVLKHEPIDYVVTFNPVPYGTVAWLLAKRFGKPISMSVIGGYDYNYHYRAWYGFVLKAILRRCNFVTGTGSAMVDDLRSCGLERETVQVLPHALELARFRAGRPPHLREFDLLYVGDLIRRKRVDLVLRAFARVLESRPSASLAIVGDGPLQAKLERLARDLGVFHRVIFFGRRQNVEDFYNSARLLLVMSEAEGLPFVMLEAMCSGCVPIVARSGSIDEVLHDGENGFLVEQHDWKAAAERVCQLLNDPERLSAMAQSVQTCRAELDWSKAEAVWRGALERAA